MGSYQDVDRVEFRDRDNIELPELKALKSGEGILVFEDQLVRSNSIYIPDNEKISSKLEVKINRFVPIKRPGFSDLCIEIPAAARRRPVSQEKINNILDICRTTASDEWHGRLNARLVDKTLLALTSLTTDIDNRNDVVYTEEERGALLFETAVRELTENGGRYQWLREQENIRISKKRIEEAHKNNASANSTTEQVADAMQPNQAPEPTPEHCDMPPFVEDDAGQGDWYQDVAGYDYSDDFISPTDLERF